MSDGKKRSKKSRKNRLMVCQTFDDQRGPFQPTTPHGQTMLEHLNQTNPPPLHPDKTRQDYMKVEDRPRFKDWQRRQAHAQRNSEAVAA